MKSLVVIGEILVEIMADTAGAGFLEPIALTGPFPSGAPAIFAAQAARYGQPTAIISAVGDDDFGRLNVARLRADGVDVSAIRVDPDRPTGSAFVRYRPDGSRDFIFNIKHSACGRLSLSDRERSVLARADHLHIMGSSLSSEAFVTENMAAARAIIARGGTVSFDPNLRKEMLSEPAVREAMGALLSLTTLFLPSGEELTALTGEATPERAIADVFGRGVRAVVHKNGRAGARYVDAERDLFVPAMPVEEVDPTGAGDCFGATFTALWLRGEEPSLALTQAAAAGALAVGVRGPMEGTSTPERVRDFLTTHGGNAS